MSDSRVYQSGNLRIDVFVTSSLAVNTYIVADVAAKQCWIVDPGGDADRLLQFIESQQYTISAIINTHGHADHIWENGALQSCCGAPIWIAAGDEAMLHDPMKNLSAMFGPPITSPAASKVLHDGDEIFCGELKWSVMHAPGHTPGEVVLLHENVAVVGDVLFAGSVGRTDFPGGSGEQLYDSIRRCLLSLPDHTIVLSGHGPSTTIGEERRNNIFLQHDGAELRMM